MTISGGYWHVVLNMDLTVAVTQNFCSSVNFPTVWTRVIRSRPKMSKKFLERLKQRRPDLARLAEKIDPNIDSGHRSDTSSSSSSSSSADSSADSPDESDVESTSITITSHDQHQRSFEQGDEPLTKKQRVSPLK
jgi:histone arginine demethylase JMJD6